MKTKKPLVDTVRAVTWFLVAAGTFAAASALYSSATNQGDAAWTAFWFAVVCWLSATVSLDLDQKT